MPGSKTETSIRFPENQDQTRRVRDTTQDQRAAEKQHAITQSDTARSQAADPIANWDPEEVFETTVNERGEPVPDPYAFVDGRKMTRGTGGQDDGDMFEAANEDFY
ncbi:hypothetical protein BDV59DRAFT_205190 [Aspergillus ambiguus]|uniref:uncharacterized protein n=1 Tax=Aspergillus ambiguus TaxID=176160 RepID=UPI003CCD67DA